MVFPQVTMEDRGCYGATRISLSHYFAFRMPGSELTELKPAFCPELTTRILLIAILYARLPAEFGKTDHSPIIRASAPATGLFFEPELAQSVSSP